MMTVIANRYGCSSGLVEKLWPLACRHNLPFECVLEDFEERAGIREHLGGFERAEAERLALLDVVNMLEKERR